MIDLSRKSLLALEAVLDVAIHARPNPVQARDITRRQNVPQRYLEKIMQALVRADILRGVRGPRGGYRLARERRRILVREIFVVIAEAESDMLVPQSSSPISAQVVAPLCEQLNARLEKELDGLTIATLCEQLQKAQKKNKSRSESDFII